MKPLIILLRIIIVGCFWSIFFIEGIRVIMLRNWRFDIVSLSHWEYAWDLWMSGWVISDAKEWAFVLIIVAFIPLWITGWAALSLVAWEEILLDIIMFPINIVKNFINKHFFGVIKINKKIKVKKKPSYKEIRPRGTRPLLDEPVATTFSTAPSEKIKKTKKSSNIESSLKKVKRDLGIENTSSSSNSIQEHSLINTIGGDDDFVFNFDAFDIEPKNEEKIESNDDKSFRNKRDKKEQENRTKDRTKNNDRSKENKNNRNPKSERDSRNKNFDKDSNKDFNNKNKKNNHNNNEEFSFSEKSETKSKNDRNSSKSQNGNILDIISQKGYDVITGTTVNNTLIDFIGVSKNKICICLLDREPGDWLADEELFNNEEPLWFSESSHRISPVRKINQTKLPLQNALSEAGFTELRLDAFVIIQLGNIINAEDMFDVWKSMNISVTRIDRGTPKDIILFAKALDEADEKLSEDDFEKIKKVIRGIK